MEKDLFGQSIEKKESFLKKSLRKYDKDSFNDRLKRLEYLQKIFPKDYGFLLRPESAFILDEVKMTFINGYFISTVMLAQAFIEHVLQTILETFGHQKLSQKNLKEIIKWFRSNKPEHNFLMKKIDHLRRFRNPFSHLKPFNDPNTITQRSFCSRVQPDEILEKETRDALELMYQVMVTKF